MNIEYERESFRSFSGLNLKQAEFTPRNRESLSLKISDLRSKFHCEWGFTWYRVMKLSKFRDFDFWDLHNIIWHMTRKIIGVSNAKFEPGNKTEKADETKKERKKWKKTRKLYVEEKHLIEEYSWNFLRHKDDSPNALKFKFCHVMT